MKLIEMCAGDATSPQVICIFTKAILIGTTVVVVILLDTSLHQLSLQC